MKAVILCGGRGTRLREHTETRPKPMVEIGGRPILWHIMKIYARFGVTDFVLCLGYLGHVVKDYFLNFQARNSDLTIELGSRRRVKYHSRPTSEDRWTVTLADTGEETQTGARLSRVREYLDDETFALTYGDGVADIDLDAALAFHRRHGRAATVTGVQPPGRFGELVNERERVVSFSEKPRARSGLINGGFFLLEPRFLDYVADDPECVLERAPLERCAQAGELYVYEHRGFWQCVDTYRDWEHLDTRMREGRTPWLASDAAMSSDASAFRPNAAQFAPSQVNMSSRADAPTHAEV